MTIAFLLLWVSLEFVEVPGLESRNPGSQIWAPAAPPWPAGHACESLGVKRRPGGRGLRRRARSWLPWSVTAPSQPRPPACAPACPPSSGLRTNRPCLMPWTVPALQGLCFDVTMAAAAHALRRRMGQPETWCRRHKGRAHLSPLLGLLPDLAQRPTPRACSVRFADAWLSSREPPQPTENLSCQLWRLGSGPRRHPPDVTELHTSQSPSHTVAPATHPADL